MKRAKAIPSRLGSAKGGYVSSLEHELLWKTIHTVKQALDKARHGHNTWQQVQDALDKLDDEFQDPDEL